MEPGRGERSPRDGNAVSGAEFAGIGLQFALSILIFALLGVWLDRRLGTSPWLLIICVFGGASAGFYSMYRKITASQRRDAERLARQRAGSGGETGPGSGKSSR